jgi:hypothetical protein
LASRISLGSTTCPLVETVIVAFCLAAMMTSRRVRRK